MNRAAAVTAGRGAGIGQLQFDWSSSVEDQDEDSVEAAFERFHRDNPQVYRELRKAVLAYRRAGHEHGGIRMFWEVLRFRRGLRTTGEAFKLNNNYATFYARRLMETEPELTGFFETRERE